jgi:hypothetical protein
MRLFYKELSERNNLQRVGMLLDAIQRHVEFLEKELLFMEKETPSDVLNAWFQFASDPPKLDTDPMERIRKGMNIDDVIHITLDFDTALIEFYQRVAESTEFVEVQEVFFNLAKSIESEKKKLVEDASGMKML